MGFRDVFGARKPAAPDLNNLFGLPAAAITLEASLGFQPTGTGAVAFRAMAGKAFDDAQSEVEALLAAGGTTGVRVSSDDFGYTWIEVSTAPPDAAALITALHAVNSTLELQGFGPQLLCTLVPFAYEGRKLAMVYLFKQGTFYPFAPEAGAQRRDNMLELQVRDLLGNDIAIEKDLGRWFAVWGAPGL